MDNSAKTPTASNSQLSNTGNPQNIGTQNLAAPKADLQTTLSQNGNSGSFTITSVGDTTFTPFNASETTLGSETTPPTLAPRTTNLVPVVTIAAVILLICAVVMWSLQKDASRKLLKR